MQVVRRRWERLVSARARLAGSWNAQVRRLGAVERLTPLARNIPTLVFAAVAGLVILLLAALAIPGLAAVGGAIGNGSSATTASGAGNASASNNAKLPVAYVDSLLGFSLHLPSDWSVRAEPVVLSRASAVERNALVSLHDPAHASDTVEVAVTESPAMVGAFARLGRPNTRVGPYPALTRDIPADSGGSGSASAAPCLVRIFLAQTSQRADYVVAQACGADILARAATFQSVIASYKPAPPKTGAAVTLAQGTAAADSTTIAAASPRPATCAQLVASAPAHPADTSNWGRELASATDPRWNPYPTPAASVCSNFYYVSGKAVGYSGYTFQCVELANRFLREQWGHGGVNGNAAQWFDYYQNGVRHDGRVRIYPDAQLSDDASQGVSAFAPGPGDILVWQDVQDGKNWTSGLSNSTGHVAVITGTDATHVYFMQENYSDTRYYMSLPLTQTASGWKITDTVSGVPGRIVRGWIHFMPDTAAPSATSPLTLSITNTQSIYAIGSDGQIYTSATTTGTTGNNAATAQLVRMTGEPNAPTLTGTPSLNAYTLDGQPVQSLYATGTDGHLYEYVTGVHNWTRNDLTALAPLPSGVRVAGSPAAVTYTTTGLNPLRHVIFAAGSDGKLYRWIWTQGSTWQAPTIIPSASTAAAVALTALSWSPAVSASTAPTASNTATPLTRDEAVYVLRSDGHLYEEFSSDGTTWQETNLSTAANAASGSTSTTPLLAGVPSAYTFTPVGHQDTQRIVFALGSNGHLYSYTYGPSANAGQNGDKSGAMAWSAADVSAVARDGAKIAESALGSGFRLVGSPSALYAPAVQQPSPTAHEVFVTGNDGHLYEYYFTDSWHTTDVSAAASLPATEKLVGSPLAYSFALKGDTAARRSVYVAAQDGTLVQLKFGPVAGSAAPAWGVVNSSAPGGVTVASSSLTGGAWTQAASPTTSPANVG